MEIVIFVAMMLTPIMAVVALLLSFANFRKGEALKKLVMDLTRITYAQDQKAAAVAEFGISEL